MGNWSINREDYLDNPHYIKYLKQKEKLLKKYDSVLVPSCGGKKGPQRNYIYTKEDEKKYKNWLKDIGDLMFKPKGHFQKFFWDIRPYTKKQNK